MTTEQRFLPKPGSLIVDVNHAETRHLIFDRDGRLLARVGSSSTDHVDEDRQIAHLFAAAPDLLDALVDLRAAYANLQDEYRKAAGRGPPRTGYSSAEQKADAAIAAAKEGA